MSEICRHTLRSNALNAAADRWMENEMWNHRERGRAADIHDLSAFIRGFSEGMQASQDIARAALASVQDGGEG